MAAFKYLIYFILLLLAFAIAAVFVNKNGAPIELDLLLWKTPSFALGSWILMGYVLGIASIILVMSLSFIKMKAGNARLNRRLIAAQNEIKRLKSDLSESTS